MGNKPLISICIPTYNRAKMLDECLLSILNQFDNYMLENIEVIISDNNSLDNTQQIIDGYIKRFKNIKYYKNKTNIGGIKNLIKVAEYANGEYIWFLSDDDCLTDFALKSVIDIIKETSCDIIFSKVKYSEDINIKIFQNKKDFSFFDGIEDYISHLYITYFSYQELISFFSFYSILIFKQSYLESGLNSPKTSFRSNNSFPHDVLVYHDLKNKKIVIPHDTFVIGRILNESYGGSLKLISDLEECLYSIEVNNSLQNHKKWKKIKKTCLFGRKKTIYLGIILKKLRLNYKTNPFLKKIYYLYKKYLQ